MTTAHADLVLSSPDAVVAGLPYLIGFAPRESAVVLWLKDRRLLVTQRLDLPDSSEQEREWLHALWSHAASREADDLIAVLVTARSDLDGLVGLLVGSAHDAGVRTRDLLQVQEGRWRSLLCGDPECCAPEGRPVDPEVESLVQAEFTGSGVSPAADRTALERDLRPGADGVLPTAPGSNGTRGSTAGRERRRDRAIAGFVAAFARDSRPEDDSLPMLIGALADVRVRDTVLWELSRLDAAGRQRALRVLVSALRVAGPGAVAPVATCTAIAAWLLGDGARAQIAVGHALEDQPDYSLAVLVQQSLRAGLPPSAWAEAMASLTREECRHGTGRPAVSHD